MVLTLTDGSQKLFPGIETPFTHHWVHEFLVQTWHVACDRTPKGVLTLVPNTNIRKMIKSQLLGGVYHGKNPTKQGYYHFSIHVGNMLCMTKGVLTAPQKGSLV